MKALLLVFLFSPIVVAKADQKIHEQVTSAPERTATFEPCTNWWYDFDLGSYVCRFKGMRMTVYTSAEVDKLVTSLQTRITALESRVKALEAKP